MYNRQLKLEIYSAKVAELVDALDLGSSAARRESSSLSFRTSIKFNLIQGIQHDQCRNCERVRATS